MYQNIRSALFGFATKYACDWRTDRRTDGTELDGSIAARTVKHVNQTLFSKRWPVVFSKKSWRIWNQVELIEFRANKKCFRSNFIISASLR